MRVGYIEDEDYGGQFSLWQANCLRSRQGRKGQKALRELEAALSGMPDKRIHKDIFVGPSGETCAIGALMIHKMVVAGMDREQAVAECAVLDPLNTENFGIMLGLPPLVAWSVAVENDEWREWHRTESPEERYSHMLAWTRKELNHEEM